MAIPMRLARDMVNGLGVNVPFNAGTNNARTATALGYLGTRWVRMQLDNGNYTVMTGLQDALVAAGVANPNLRLMALENAYIQNGAINTITAQKGWLASLYAKHGPDGTTILKAIEGPNEMNNPNVGTGSRGPSDTTNKTDAVNWPSTFSTIANANLIDWANQTHAWAVPTVPGVTLIGGTVIYFNGTDYPIAQLDIRPYADYAAAHYYSSIGGSNKGVPSDPPAISGNLTGTYNHVQAGMSPGLPLWATEGGVSTENASTGWSLVGATRNMLMAYHDWMAMGGKRYFIYTLFNNDASTQGSPTSSTQDNFGAFWPDGTPKPHATALRNLLDLYSLGLSVDNAANLTDTAAYTPGLDGSGMSVTGLTSAGTSGSSMLLAKTDGSYMVAVWNEPLIDTGNSAVTPSANVVTVNFGTSMLYRVYDPTGGGGVANFTAARNLTPIAIGSGSSVSVTLYGSPMLVEVVPVAASRVIIRDQSGRRLLLGSSSWLVGP
jgi:hypothetical protein